MVPSCFGQSEAGLGLAPGYFVHPNGLIEPLERTPTEVFEREFLPNAPYLENLALAGSVFY